MILGAYQKEDINDIGWDKNVNHNRGNGFSAVTVVNAWDLSLPK